MHAFRLLHHPFFLVFLTIALVLHVLLVVVPGFMILRKMGYSGWWVLVNYLPLGTIIGLWLLATANWPVERRVAAASPPSA
jgi:RsiW-degrading membrane proteinase PrsW (M82 family)